MTHDVIVVGGGSAGVAAAVGAAREGARTALLEPRQRFGGMATYAWVGTICGLYLRNSGPESIYVSEGFPKEFADRLRQQENTQPTQFDEGLHFLPYHPDSFAQLCDELLAEAGVDMIHQAVTSCHTDRNTITTLHTSDNSALECAAVVDCTGEALISMFAGARVISSEHPQDSAIVFSFSQLPDQDPHVLRMSILRDVLRGIQQGELPEWANRLSIVPGSHFFKLGLPSNLTDYDEVTEHVTQLCNYLTENCPTLNGGVLDRIAPSIGKRSGNRPHGLEVLTREDVLQARKHPQSVARGAWPIESWDGGPKPRMEYFAERDYYDIPAGALQSAELENLFFAGKSFSAEDDAMASARVMGTCLATGFASGKLAAAYSKENS